MLALRVKDQFHFGRNTFTNVANIFMHYRYAQAAVTKEEFEQVNDFHVELLKKQRNETKKLQLLFEEFLFLSKKSNR